MFFIGFGAKGEAGPVILKKLGIHSLADLENIYANWACTLAKNGASYDMV